MAERPNIFTQLDGAATTNETLYTVPKDKDSRVVARLRACNRTAAAINLRVALGINGGAIADKGYLLYDTPLAPNDALPPIDLALGPGDVVYVRASATGISWTLMGILITA